MATNALSRLRASSTTRYMIINPIRQSPSPALRRSFASWLVTSRISTPQTSAILITQRRLYAKQSRPPGQPVPAISPNPADNVRHSTKQEEITESGADPSQNTFTTPRLDPSAPHPAGTEPHVSRESSDTQPELTSQAGLESDTTPEGESGPHETYRQIELPDLTQGIPSTLDAELAQRRRASGGPTAPLSLEQTPSPDPNEGEAQATRSFVSDLERRRQRAANIFFASLFAIFSGTAVYLGRNWDTPEEEAAHYDAPSGWGLLAFYKRIRARVSGVTSYYTEPTSPKLLLDKGREHPDHFLVVSLEDLLVHSEWSREHGWRLAKRPGVDYFLQYLSQYYEIAVWTSMPFQSAVGMLLKLDPYKLVYPMFREACLYQNGEHVKDISYLNRDLSKIIVLDTDPSHVRNQPENAIIVPKWDGTPGDKGLVAYIPFLEFLANSGAPDIRPIVASFHRDGKQLDVPAEYAEREARARKLFYEEQEKSGKRKRRSSAAGQEKQGGLWGQMRPQPVMVGPNGEVSRRVMPVYDGETYIMDFVRMRGQATYEEMAEGLRVNGPAFLKESEELEKADQEKAKKELKESLSLRGLSGKIFGRKEGGGEDEEK